MRFAVADDHIARELHESGLEAATQQIEAGGKLWRVLSLAQKLAQRLFSLPLNPRNDLGSD